MAQKRYQVEQIVAMLRRADVELGQGKKVPEVCKLLGISQQTYYRWRQKASNIRALLKQKELAPPRIIENAEVFA